MNHSALQYSLGSFLKIKIVRRIATFKLMLMHRPVIKSIRLLIVYVCLGSIIQLTNGPYKSPPMIPKVSGYSKTL